MTTSRYVPARLPLPLLIAGLLLGAGVWGCTQLTGTDPTRATLLRPGFPGCLERAQTSRLADLSGDRAAFGAQLQRWRADGRCTVFATAARVVVEERGALSRVRPVGASDAYWVPEEALSF
jgi:hypothetical protein